MDEKTFETLVERFYQPLYRFALALARDEAQAADLTQQAFLQWARKGETLKDPSKVKTWLFTTLYREYLGQKRREARHPTVELEPASPELPTVDPVALARLEAEEVLAALGELDEVFRVPLVLFYLQELSYAEIAQLLQVPLGTVMSRLARGKEKLRMKLAERTSYKKKERGKEGGG
ncbi:RNA polymerase sigma factor [Candidatus Methylacidithermus pantelleriae]|nr:RNA polymerase sigma factor [Candidatus Methylacidithermus pantelleriae]